MPAVAARLTHLTMAVAMAAAAFTMQALRADEPAPRAVQAPAVVVAAVGHIRS